ncbi:MAG: PIN domain-containing protein [Deltaproteobacteria bacterium]|nr:PIN domain-containing protein [Deltaproteobacteria bacterium]
MLNRLLDSVILIDHFNNIPKATAFILSLKPEQTSISVITRAEILVGIADEDKDKVLSFLDQYAILPIDKEIADIAADLRQKHGWKLPDAFQSAIAVHYHIKLCTRNTKDFNPRKHLFIEIPYKVT